MIVAYNELYLALIRPVFCIGAIVKPNWNKVCKKKHQEKREVCEKFLYKHSETIE